MRGQFIKTNVSQSVNCYESCCEDQLNQIYGSWNKNSNMAEMEITAALNLASSE